MHKTCVPFFRHLWEELLMHKTIRQQTPTALFLPVRARHYFDPAGRRLIGGVPAARGIACMAAHSRLTARAKKEETAVPSNDELKKQIKQMRLKFAGYLAGGVVSGIAGLVSLIPAIDKHTAGFGAMILVPTMFVLMIKAMARKQDLNALNESLKKQMGK